MTPTTILIEREADAKVFEVIENLYPDVRWDSGRKPSQYKEILHEHYIHGRQPYAISVDTDGIIRLDEVRYATPATEWLAQHGYVWDGYRLNIETPIHPAVVHMNADPDFLKNPDDVKVNIKLVQEAYDTPVEPVSAPTRTEQEPLIVTMEKQKQATIDKIKLSDRTEQREKRLKQAGYVLEGRNWVYRNSEGYGSTWIGDDHVAQFTDEEFNNRMGFTDPQTAPYTAGQEVEVKWISVSDQKPNENDVILCYGKGDRMFTAIFKNDVFIVWDELDLTEECEDVTHWMPLPGRPVQVQPEMPEWEKYWREQFWRLIKAYKFEDSGRQLEIDSAIEKLRPLITSKQVTDDEIQQKWVELLGSSNWPHFDIVRWALQKAEGGEG